MTRALFMAGSLWHFGVDQPRRHTVHTDVALLFYKQKLVPHKNRPGQGGPGRGARIRSPASPLRALRRWLADSSVAGLAALGRLSRNDMFGDIPWAVSVFVNLWLSAVVSVHYPGTRLVVERNLLVTNFSCPMAGAAI